METSLTTIDTTTDDGEMAVVIVEPVSPAEGPGQWPTVLWFMDLPGIRPAVHDGMSRLAREGYRVIAPDLHHRHGRLLHVEPDVRHLPETGEKMTLWLSSMTDDQIQHDGACALRAANVAENTPIVAIGFCLGARAVYRTIERQPDRVLAGSSFHPSFLADDGPTSPHLTAGDVATPMYFGIGEDDGIQSIEMHQRFLDAVEPLPHVDVVTFPHTDHGFTWPGYPNYSEVAAETSWAKTFELFASAFSAA